MFALLIKQKVSRITTYSIIFLTGMLSGMIVQMHYLTAFVIIIALLFPIVIDRRFRTIIYYLLYMLGIVIGIAPYLLFEIRHNFFNTQKAIEYIFSATSKHNKRNIMNAVSAIPNLLSKLITGNNLIMSWIIFVGGFLLSIKDFITLKISKNNKTVRLIILYLILTIVVIVLYGHFIQTHYIIGIHSLLFILLALFISDITKLKNWLLFELLLIIVFINAPFWYLHTSYHPLQDSLRISDFEKTAKYIYQVSGNNTYNITMDAQTNNRAWPLRYFLMLTDRPPQNIYYLRKTDYLYVLVRKNKPLNQLTMWEFTSFGKYKILHKVQINDSYWLYQLSH